MLGVMRLALALSIALAIAVFAAPNAVAQCLSAPALEAVRAEGQAAEAGLTWRDRIGRVVAPMTVNGQGPFRFIVDTGANRSVLSQRLTERLGLTPNGEGEVHSVHGVSVAPFVSVDALRYGDLAVPSAEMPVLQGAMLAGEQGLLGVDGMQGRRLRFDFEGRCIEIVPSEGARRLGRGWTRLRGELRFGHLVVVQGRVEGVRVNVLIDTGSNVSLANRALHAALAARIRQGRSAEAIARAYTAGQPVVLDTAILIPELALDQLRISDVVVFVGDFHVFSLWGLEDEPTVLVGMDVLSQTRALAIDYGRATVHFRLQSRPRGSRIDGADFMTSR